MGAVTEVAAKEVAGAVVAKEAARVRVAAARAEEAMEVLAIGCSSPGTCRHRWGNSCQRARNTPCAFGRRRPAVMAAPAVTAARREVVPMAARASTRLRNPLAMLRREVVVARRAAHRVGRLSEDESSHA